MTATGSSPSIWIRTGSTTRRVILGVEAIPFALEISSPEKVRAVSQKIRQKHGEVSLLVNNAGLHMD
jgi:short-subunit dehydrogenase